MKFKLPCGECVAMAFWLTFLMTPLGFIIFREQGDNESGSLITFIFFCMAFGQLLNLCLYIDSMTD